MALRLDDTWIWDSWVVRDGATYHLFFLQAPSALGDPSLRHARATIGHATSTDLLSWDHHGLAFAPSDHGWDDLATWTGSVVRGDDGTWRMFYTALSTAGHGLRDQRIGLAESDDLYTWRRVGDRPILEADAQWYKTLGIKGNPARETWRDPFVFRDPDGDGWHLLVTARLQGAPPARRRRSSGTPAAPTSDLGAMGPPCRSTRRASVSSRCHRSASSTAEPCWCSPVIRRSRAPYAASRAATTAPGRSSPTPLLGPWDVSIGPAVPRRALPVRRAPGHRPLRRLSLVGFRNTEPQGRLQFEITDPIPVGLRAGALVPRA